MNATTRHNEHALRVADRMCARHTGQGEIYGRWRRKRGCLLVNAQQYRQLSDWEEGCLSQSIMAGDVTTCDLYAI